VSTERYIVHKKFTDWGTDQKFLAGDEPDLTDEIVRSSMTMRNAIAQGWMQKIVE
jgi:hypothetical protein